MKTGYSIPDSKFYSYYISTLSRTRETAQNIFGVQDYIATDLINEVPLSACFNTEAKLPLLFWNITGRIQWYFNDDRQKDLF
jgi:hypothetical protein